MNFIDEDTIIIEGILPMYLKESFLRKKMVDTSFISGIMELGWGNGYVGLPKWHPWFNKDYDEIPVRIHGGLTYSTMWDDGEETLWIIGFDTHHYNDNLTNCSFEYVKQETERLRKQCMEAEGMEMIIRFIKLNRIKKSLTN